MKKYLALPAVCLLTTTNGQNANGIVPNVHTLTPQEYPLPRAVLPDGFGAKVAFQTVSRTDPKTKDKIVSERLVRCGIGKLIFFFVYLFLFLYCLLISFCTV